MTNILPNYYTSKRQSYQLSLFNFFHYFLVTQVYFHISNYNVQMSAMKSQDFSRFRMDSAQERSLTSSLSTKFIHSEQNINELQLQKTQITLFSHQLQQELKIYDWRAKTQFPIVKINSYAVLEQLNEKTLLEVSYEHYPLRVIELKDIPLVKILYLLKETIIGSQRLFDKFGSFMITPKMVALTKQGKCKIWINQNFAINEFKSYSIDQKYFMTSICKLFECRSNKLKNTMLFFHDLAQCKTFCQGLTFIQNYARENKISIPTSCKFVQKQLSLAVNNSNNGFDPTMTMSRAPKFLNSNLRASLKQDSKNIFAGIFQSLSIKELGQNKIQEPHMMMKTSGNTAADIYASKTMSFSNQGEEHDNIEQSLIFGQKQPKDIIFKSQLPIKVNQVNCGFHRKFNSHNQDLHCLTPNIDKRDWEDQHFLSLSKWDDKAFYNDDEDEGLSKEDISNLFSKNSWQKTINGLFAEDTQMKKSFTHGKQRRKNQHGTSTLMRLGSMGKNIHQSFINDQSDPNQN